MQDRYQTSISTYETAVRTAAGRWSFGVNAEEFMSGKFLFGLSESFSRLRELSYFHDSAQIGQKTSGQIKTRNVP